MTTPDNSDEIILVFGATGNQGGAVIERLLFKRISSRSNFRIRVLVRKPNADSVIKMQRSGVEIYQGSMDDSASIKAALKDVTRIFLNTTYDKHGGELWPVEEKRGLTVVNELVKLSTLKQVIYSTLPAIEGYSEGAGKTAIENKMRELKLPLTTVLSPFYLENFINVWPPIRKWFGLFGPLQWGWLPTQEPLRMPHGSVKDFGGVVASILLLPEKYYLKRQVTVTSQDLLLSEVLTEIRKGLGKSLHWKPIPRPVFRNLPFPKEALDGLEFYADGLSDLQQVEEGFLQTQGKGVASLEAAIKETAQLYPEVQGVEAWARDNAKELSKRSFKKFMVSMMIFWARLKVAVN